MSLEQIITTYGYAAVGIGTFLEGETILVLAGLAAHRGYLSLPGVIFCAFLGTLFGDQLFFHIGRRKGKAALERRPHWQAKSEKVLSLLERHQVWLILGFRFVYGFRTVTPFVIGASNVGPLRFLVLNVIGASAWAIVIGTAGYLFGQAVEVLIGDIRKYEMWLFAVVIAVGAGLWLVHLRKK